VLAGRLPIEATLAPEIGPVEPEYGLTLDDRPSGHNALFGALRVAP
jgi:hypothetical protein